MKDVCYINFLNKDKNFHKETIYFKGLNEAIKWGRNNIDNFNIDMIKWI